MNFSPDIFFYNLSFIPVLFIMGEELEDAVGVSGKTFAIFCE